MAVRKYLLWIQTSFFLQLFFSGNVYAHPQNSSPIAKLSSRAPIAYGLKYNGFSSIEYAMFFGDSYTNNKYDVNAAPHPTISQPLGVTWPGLGSPNGPNWAAYLVSVLNSSRIFGFDIAFGGATVDRQIVSPFADYIWDFKDQVARWKNRLGNLAKPWAAYPWRPENTMFFVWVGINDIMRSYAWTNVSMDDHHNRVLDSYFQGVTSLYNSGARNFVFLNVPAIHRAPTNLSPTTRAAQVYQNVVSYNTKLRVRVDAFAASSPELTVWHINAFQMFESMLNNPLQFGFKNSTGTCAQYKPYSWNADWESKFEPGCGVPVKEYFWLDSLHPTSGVHWLVANAVRWAL